MRTSSRIFMAVLVAVLLMAFVVPAAQAGSGEPWNRPGLQALRRFIQVNVTTPTGKLMPSWRSFIERNYPGWTLSQAPFHVGRWWYVVLTRMTYTMPTLPSVVAPYLREQGSCYPVYYKGCKPRMY